MAMKPAQPLPYCMWMPRGWMSPQVRSAPYRAGGSITPREETSGITMPRAPAWWARSMTSLALGWKTPRKEGFSRKTAAVFSESLAFRSSRSRMPPGSATGTNVPKGAQ